MVDFANVKVDLQLLKYFRGKKINDCDWSRQFSTDGNLKS